MRALITLVIVIALFCSISCGGSGEHRASDRECTEIVNVVGTILRSAKVDSGEISLRVEKGPRELVMKEVTLTLTPSTEVLTMYLGSPSKQEVAHRGDTAIASGWRCDVGVGKAGIVARTFSAPLYAS